MSNDLSRPAKHVLERGREIRGTDDETAQEYEGRLVLLLAVLEIALQAPDREHQLEIREAVENLRGEVLDMMFAKRFSGAFAKGVGEGMQAVTDLLYQKDL